MSDKSLVIVESPTKARTITRFLGREFVVLASNGHVRDLPNGAAEIPPKLKKEKWAPLGVNVDSEFEALYVVPKNKKDQVKKLKDALKNATEVFLATDEDREGESISWHLLEVLKPKVPVKRLVFHEITKDAIAKALASPRSIDENLVRAQETRRIVDRLFGYEVSPLLWKKMIPGLSAGRVQSVTVRLLVQRERERMKFVNASYWSLKGAFSKPNNGSTTFDAELYSCGEKRIATGKDFNSSTGELNDPSKVLALPQDEAEKLKQDCLEKSPVVDNVEEKPYTSRPAPPFVTSTLQQEANRKLRFSARRTMNIAQQLYENGFITYMRTDSTTLSEQALAAARSLIQADYGSEYLPDKARVYTTKVKNAQEAHEAIRPAGDRFATFANVKDKLGIEAAKLYELIWKRTVASQMADAKGTHSNIIVRIGDAKFRASGKTISFPGYLRAYVEGSDDPESELADQERILPKVAVGEDLRTSSLETLELTTQPPGRYTEGSLIKELERLGIGRPSTWATVVETVLSRSYAFKKSNALVPTFTGFAVVNLLEKHFTKMIDYQFTAQFEDDLDSISRGEAQNLDYLRAFYFGNTHPGLKALIKMGEEKIDPREINGIPLGKDPEEDVMIEVRIGRYGPYITDGTRRASVPDAAAPDEVTVEAAAALLRQAAKGPEPLGSHPESGEPIFLKVGPYGPYVQQGEGTDKEKIKMASLLSNMSDDQMNLELALKLLSLPRTLGEHPEMKEEIIAANGRYGPYVKCGSETRSINLDEHSPLDITLEQALEVLKQPKGRRASAQPKLIRDLGTHPVSEKQLTIKTGRYGPYVTDGEINASLRKGMTPETLTMDDAVELLDARAARIEAQGGKPKRKRATKKKAPAKKKPAAKKETAAKAKAKPKAKAKAKAKKAPAKSKAKAE